MRIYTTCNNNSRNKTSYRRFIIHVICVVCVVVVYTLDVKCEPLGQSVECVCRNALPVMIYFNGNHYINVDKPLFCANLSFLLCVCVCVSFYPLFALRAL